MHTIQKISLFVIINLSILLTGCDRAQPQNSKPAHYNFTKIEFKLEQMPNGWFDLQIRDTFNETSVTRKLILGGMSEDQSVSDLTDNDPSVNLDQLTGSELNKILSKTGPGYYFRARITPSQHGKYLVKFTYYHKRGHSSRPSTYSSTNRILLNPKMGWYTMRSPIFPGQLKKPTSK